jgi:hypothetical protein
VEIREDFSSKGFPRDTNVNSRGPTTFLWIKRFFGFCGELWLILVFWGDHVWFCGGILGGDAWELCFFEHEIRGQFVVNAWFLCGFLLVENDADKRPWG